MPPTLRVFIADDSALVRERLAALLCDAEGVELVGQAQDAQGTIEAVLRLEPDALILDLHMPGGNGFQVLETVRQNVPHTIVIVLTAFPYPRYRRICLEAGARYFLDKATESGQLLEVLQQLRHASEGTQP